MAEVLGTSSGGCLGSISEVREAGFWIIELWCATQKFGFHPVVRRFEGTGDIYRYQVLKGHSKPWGVRLEANRPVWRQLQKPRGDQGLDIHFGAFSL